MRFAWLVEYPEVSGPVYFGADGWTTSADQALQFRSEREATFLKARLELSGEVREHGFDCGKPDAIAVLKASGEQIARYFKYAHLRPELQAISRPFAELAATIVTLTPRSAERTVALRKLLESKDAAVRAALPPDPEDA